MVVKYATVAVVSSLAPRLSSICLARHRILQIGWRGGFIARISSDNMDGYTVAGGLTGEGSG